MNDQNVNVLVGGFYYSIEALTDKEEELLRKIPPYDRKTRRKTF
jgi:hypothetical protein